MRGRAFLETAPTLAARDGEADWRSAASRAYYALFHEARAALIRWSFAVVQDGSAHSFVRLRFVFAADEDLKVVGRTLENLSRLRNRADYEIGSRDHFETAEPTIRAINSVSLSFLRLDAIEADPARRLAAIASIRS